ncbi:MAG: hypothetical protein ACRD4D_05715 [Candidatus Acidiferrales bacterium]
MTAELPLADTLSPGSDRRRSPRVLLVIPVEVAWTSPSGVRVQEHAETEIVNAHGALLRMKARLPRGAVVQLTRIRTHDKAEARVVFTSDPGLDGLFRAGVELAAPGEKFWGVTLPPSSAPLPSG